MSAVIHLNRLLKDLRAIDGQLPLEEQISRVKKCLQSCLSAILKGNDGISLHLDLHDEYPYVAAAGPLDASLRETVDTALEVVNNHLDLVREIQITRDLLSEHDRRSTHEFIHPLSHYMKSPLTAILGYTSLLEDELGSVSDQEIRHYIRRIGDNTRILIDMIDDLLYLSRLKREPTEILDVGELVRESLKPFRELMARNKLRVTVQNPIPPLVMNPEHGKTLFTQLLSNALRHAFPDTGIRVGFEGEEYCIEDRGPGISRVNLEKVFQIFFTTCSKDSRCTGAGLYTVRSILELYRGTVRIESSPGKGTSVYFSTGSETS
jgi:signal transduction histidine kinase